MLPLSVLARAKMKMAFGQLELLPCSRSFLVLVLEKNWRVWRVAAFGAMGEAAAKLMIIEMARNFMLAWFQRVWLEKRVDVGCCAC